jgi:serine/threonine-protein kinase HipA
VNEEATEVIRCAEVYQSGELAGYLQEQLDRTWVFAYEGNYEGIPVSLTLPVRREPYSFKGFPPVFEGLLPEGPQLEALLKTHKIDRHDAFTQLVIVGEDLVGSLTVCLSQATKHKEGR